MRLPDRFEGAYRQRLARASVWHALQERTAEWFEQQRSFYTDPSRLTAALCGRRAGKTRGGCLAMLLEAARTPNGRFLYLNETRPECLKLAWHGLRGDGMFSLALKLGLPVKPNESNLTLHFPSSDSWIFLMGADDEAGVRKALGLAYHRVWWDEAQKIPPKLEQVITEVLMPTLLDYGGRIQLTGTPVRAMSGLFYNVTRGDQEALKRWSVHRWNLLDNTFFGRAVRLPRGWVVLGKAGRQVAGPFKTAEETTEAVAAERFRGGMLDLQELLGGPEAAPLDSPIMQREGYGKWVKEDALFVYDVHKVPAHTLVYAPARWKSAVIPVARMSGDVVVSEERAFPKFPDVERAIEDLPGWPSRDYFFALAADIGYRDPFAWSLGAWSLCDPVLYEVASWGHSELDAPTQAAILRYLCNLVHIGVIAADAGGSALPTVKGWSAEWSARYGVSIDEMEKSNKGTAISACNGDILRAQFRFREGSPLLDQFGRVQWSSIRTSSGKLTEDPTIPNDVADAGLYMHRRSLAHRFRETPPPPAPGTPEYDAFVERKIEEDFEDDYELFTHQ